MIAVALIVLLMLTVAPTMAWSHAVHKENGDSVVDSFACTCKLVQYANKSDVKMSEDQLGLLHSNSGPVS